MSSTTKPTLAIMAAACLWGLLGWFSYILMSCSLSLVQIVELRALSGGAFMTALLLCRSPKLLAIRLRDAWMFIGTGICSLLFFNVMYLSTFAASTLAIAVMLLYTAPVFVMLLSVLIFKESLTRDKLLALGSTIMGCLFLSGLLSGSWQCPPMALVTGILSGFGYALYSIFSKFALRRYDAATISAYTFYSAALPLLPFCNPGEMFGIILHNPQAAAATVGISVLSTVMPYLLYTYGLKYVEAGRAAILAMLEPVVGCIIGLTLLHEPLTAAKAAGLAFIMAAIVILNRRSFYPHKSNGMKSSR